MATKSTKEVQNCNIKIVLVWPPPFPYMVTIGILMSAQYFILPKHWDLLLLSTGQWPTVATTVAWFHLVRPSCPSPHCSRDIGGSRPHPLLQNPSHSESDLLPTCCFNATCFQYQFTHNDGCKEGDAILKCKQEIQGREQRWKNVQTLQTRLCYFFPWLC